MPTFGERLRAERTARGMTQMDLAAEMRRLGDPGADPPTISDLERGGTKNPGLDRVVLLARLFSVSADYLLALTDDREASWLHSPGQWNGRERRGPTEPDGGTPLAEQPVPELAELIDEPLEDDQQEDSGQRHAGSA